MHTCVDTTQHEAFSWVPHATQHVRRSTYHCVRIALRGPLAAWNGRVTEPGGEARDSQQWNNARTLPVHTRVCMPKKLKGNWRNWVQSPFFTCFELEYTAHCRWSASTPCSRNSHWRPKTSCVNPPFISILQYFTGWASASWQLPLSAP